MWRTAQVNECFRKCGEDYFQDLAIGYKLEKLFLLTRILLLSGAFFTLQGELTIFENPRELLTPHRFDIAAKYIYAKHCDFGVEDVWAQELYKAHLAPWNAFKEEMPHSSSPHYHCAKNYTVKNNFQDFVNSFKILLNDFKKHGFDRAKSVLPINQYGIIMDGAHRSATAILYNESVICESFKVRQSACYDAKFFKNCNSAIAKGGVASHYLDAMALTYAQLKNNTYIACIFPKAHSHYKNIQNILNDHGKIVYEKEINCYNNGPLNLMRLFYSKDGWIGNWHNDFKGAISKINACFPQGSGILKIILFECNILDLVLKAKEQIRSLCKIGHDSIHINDYHTETILLARTFFVDNSVHWLNNAKLLHCKNFENYISHYKEWINKSSIDDECLCIDTSAVLSAYGVRDCNDLDILHHGYDEELSGLSNNFKKIASHNSEMKYHQLAKEEIIFNPRNHFYYFGIKCASLAVIKAFKEARKEQKDLQDLNLIASIDKK